MISFTEILVVTALLFSVSLLGLIMHRNNVVSSLMCIELLLLAVNTQWIACAYFLNDLAGQLFVFFILTVAAAEAAVGLAIIVVLFRKRGTINLASLNSLKG